MKNRGKTPTHTRRVARRNPVAPPTAAKAAPQPSAQPEPPIARAFGESAAAPTTPLTKPSTTPQAPPHDPASNGSLLSAMDLYLFNEGSHTKLYEKLGAHPMNLRGEKGIHFAVWAPSARSVSVIGSFNQWNRSSHPLTLRESSGIWEGFVPGLDTGTLYKFHIASKFKHYSVDKADPFAFQQEIAPQTASVVSSLDYHWGDVRWMEKRGARNSLNCPTTIYEMHLGSWKRKDGRFYSYRELAPILTEHLQKLGFTHVEFLPVMEHPFYGSWGYQVTGYFATTSRYGSPADLMYLIDYLHQHEIGVILDWVPSHFPSDEHSLAYFDGTHLFEHEDPRQGFHPDWNSLIFNYGRNEVRSFLMSSAIFWLDRFHADGLRVDAVASMLYLDYSRKQGEWIPNVHGGRENIEAIGFLRRLNEEVYRAFPDVQMIAEESTSWPMVSRPAYLGGLGFGMKWDMGWMHDMLNYMALDPIHRKFHHSKLTFRQIYAYSENFVLPLSHDEVVHGKGSLPAKMPGDSWQKFANLRLLIACMYAQPGKKLLFMGMEFGQMSEWNHDTQLEWQLLEHPRHLGMERWVGDLNRLYAYTSALHESDFDQHGFEWIDCCDSDQSVVSFLRKGSKESDVLVVVLNFTPEPRYNYQVGVPEKGFWKEVLNSDSLDYWGSGQGNMGGVESAPIPLHGRRHSLTLTLPPLGALFFKLKERRDLDRGEGLKPFKADVAP